MNATLEELRQAVAFACAETDANPSEAQTLSGNYRKGKVRLFGLNISIETPKGAVRQGKTADGKRWAVVMPVPYGYILQTESEADGDHLDVFIGPDLDSEVVFVVDQNKPDSVRFDEHKIMLGFRNEAEARQTYLASFTGGYGSKIFRSITPMTLPVFRQWVTSGDTKTPISDRKVQRYEFKESDHPRDDDGKFTKLSSRTFYHSTHKTAAKSLETEGIDEGSLNSRDSGFFGAGFYTSKVPQDFYGKSLVAVTLKPESKILEVGELRPDAPQNWHTEFINSLRGRILKHRPNIDADKLQSILDEVTPGKPGFSHISYAQEVSNYARSEGFDAVSFANGQETVIINPKAVESIKHVGGLKAAEQHRAKLDEPQRYALTPGESSGVQHRVGDMQTINGKQYRFNERSRWERADKEQAQGEPKQAAAKPALARQDLDAAAKKATANIHPTMKGVIEGIHADPDYAESGAKHETGLDSKTAKLAYGFLQANLRKGSAGGGEIRDLGNGKLGFASAAGALALTPDGKAEYTVHTQTVADAAAGKQPPGDADEIELELADDQPEPKPAEPKPAEPQQEFRNGIPVAKALSPLQDAEFHRNRTKAAHAQALANLDYQKYMVSHHRATGNKAGLMQAKEAAALAEYQERVARREHREAKQHHEKTLAASQKQAAKIKPPPVASNPAVKAPSSPASKATGPKPPHELTRKEFEASGQKATDHKQHIKSALKGGKRIPLNVLKDYPELIAEYARVRDAEKPTEARIAAEGETLVTPPPAPKTAGLSEEDKEQLRKLGFTDAHIDQMTVKPKSTVIPAEALQPKSNAPRKSKPKVETPENYPDASQLSAEEFASKAMSAEEAKALVSKIRAGDPSSKNKGVEERNIMETGPLVKTKIPLSVFHPDYINYLKESTDSNRVNKYAETGNDTPIYALPPKEGLTTRRRNGWQVSDGGHRVMAAIQRGEKYINALVPPEAHKHLQGVRPSVQTPVQDAVFQDANGVRRFLPSSEFKDVPKGTIVSPGVETILNKETGRIQARWHPKTPKATVDAFHKRHGIPKP